MLLFKDRLEAGEKLAAVLLSLVKSSPCIVYGLPRGGVPIAKVISTRLQCPLSVIVSKKISLAFNPELALGAITAEGDTIWNAYNDHFSASELTEAREKVYSKAKEQWSIFEPFCPEISPLDKIAIVVDDGIATGMTIMAAAISLKKQSPLEIWIAAPVAPPQIIEELQGYGDRLIILETPEPFFSVSRFYLDFPQFPTEKVIEQLTVNS